MYRTIDGRRDGYNDGWIEGMMYRTTDINDRTIHKIMHEMMDR